MPQIQAAVIIILFLTLMIILMIFLLSDSIIKLRNAERMRLTLVKELQNAGIVSAYDYSWYINRKA